MFDWLRRIGWYFDKDESGSGGSPDNSTEEDAEKTDKSTDSNAGDDKKKDAKEEKLYSKAQLEDIVKERLKNEHKKSEAAAEKARKEAEEAALAKNQEWQKLAETRATELETLTKEKTELEPFKDQAEKYRTALTAILDKQKKSLPKFILPLIEKMDPVEAMAYITEHAEELGAKPETYSETPEGKEKKVSDEDKKAAEQASSTLIARSF